MKDFDGVFVGLLFDELKGAVDDPLGHCFFAVEHHHVDKFGNIFATEFGVSENNTFGYFATTRHVGLPYSVQPRPERLSTLAVPSTYFSCLGAYMISAPLPKSENRSCFVAWAAGHWPGKRRCNGLTNA
jgi:hypothetical protein